MNDLKPVVTVLVMTYNHQDFIEQALESALMQVVDFPFEILVSEDCSIDRTREIVIHYQKKHPDRIRLLLSEQNLHSNEIVSRGLRAARGKYIALLDGDDYWVSSTKLQKQVNFLEAHPKCSICFHNAVVIDEEENQPPWNWTPEGQKMFSTLEDIWMGNFIATCSTMFRNGLIGDPPGWYASMFPITDWPLHLLNAEHGLIGYLPDVMGVYRYHRGGLYSPFSEEQKQAETLKFYKTMDQNLDYRYSQIIRTSISRYFFEWAEAYEQRGEHKRARACFRNGLSAQPFNRYYSARKLAKMTLQLYLPSLFGTNRNL